MDCMSAVCVLYGFLDWSLTQIAVLGLCKGALLLLLYFSVWIVCPHTQSNGTFRQLGEPTKNRTSAVWGAYRRYSPYSFSDTRGGLFPNESYIVSTLPSSPLLPARLPRQCCLFRSSGLSYPARRWLPRAPLACPRGKIERCAVACTCGIASVRRDSSGLPP